MSGFFLLNLKLSGIKNIEKPIEIPFYKKTIKDDFDPEKYRIKGIYGENGSGKTAIMTAVKLLTRILLDRNYLSDSVNQRLLAENINKKTRKCHLETTFYAFRDVGPFIYHYQVDLVTRENDRVYIKREKLESKIGRYTQNPYLTVFETRDGRLLQYDKGEVLEACREKTQNLLETRSFATFTPDIASSGIQPKRLLLHHLESLMFFAANIHVWIDGEDDHRNYALRQLQTNGTEVLHEGSDLAVYSWASTAGNDRKEVMVPKSQIQQYREREKQLFSFIRIFKTSLKGIGTETKEYGDFYLCRRVMVYDGYELDEEYESRGIRKLIALFDAMDAACRGEIIFIDELDSNINDIYLDKLIEYFVRYGKGQLCFTAHNLSPMSILRNNRCAISFISAVNTVHTWTSNGNQTPEHAYREGFIEDSPFNVDSSDFLGILGGADE